jgi:hypothetical protein
LPLGALAANGRRLAASPRRRAEADARAVNAACLSGVLAQFDLPAVYRELAAKELQVIEPWNAEEQFIERESE